MNLIETLFNPVGAAARDSAARAQRARAQLAGAPKRTGPGPLVGLLLAAGGAAAGALAAFLLDPERGRARRARFADQAAAAVRRGARQARGVGRATRSAVDGRMAALTVPESGVSELNDAALAQKVESQLFRSRKALKGTINVNVEGGIVVLRGEVPDGRVRQALEDRAAAIEGVWSVRNLLHLPGEAASEALVRTAG